MTVEIYRGNVDQRVWGTPENITDKDASSTASDRDVSAVSSEVEKLTGTADKEFNSNIEPLVTTNLSNAIDVYEEFNNDEKASDYKKNIFLKEILNSVIFEVKNDPIYLEGLIKGKKDFFKKLLIDDNQDKSWLSQMKEVDAIKDSDIFELYKSYNQFLYNSPVLDVSAIKNDVASTVKSYFNLYKYRTISNLEDNVIVLISFFDSSDKYESKDFADNKDLYEIVKKYNKNKLLTINVKDKEIKDLLEEVSKYKIYGNGAPENMDMHLRPGLTLKSIGNISEEFKDFFKKQGKEKYLDLLGKILKLSPIDSNIPYQVAAFKSLSDLLNKRELVLKSNEDFKNIKPFFVSISKKSEYTPPLAVRFFRPSKGEIEKKAEIDENPGLKVLFSRDALRRESVEGMFTVLSDDLIEKIFFSFDEEIGAFSTIEEKVNFFISVILTDSFFSQEGVLYYSYIEKILNKLKVVDKEEFYTKIKESIESLVGTKWSRKSYFKILGNIDTEEKDLILKKASLALGLGKEKVAFNKIKLSQYPNYKNKKDKIMFKGVKIDFNEFIFAETEEEKTYNKIILENFNEIDLQSTIIKLKENKNLGKYLERDMQLKTRVRNVINKEAYKKRVLNVYDQTNTRDFFINFLRNYQDEITFKKIVNADLSKIEEEKLLKLFENICENYFEYTDSIAEEDGHIHNMNMFILKVLQFFYDKHLKDPPKKADEESQYQKIMSRLVNVVDNSHPILLNQLYEGDKKDGECFDIYSTIIKAQQEFDFKLSGDLLIDIFRNIEESKSGTGSLNFNLLFLFRRLYDVNYCSGLNDGKNKGKKGNCYHSFIINALVKFTDEEFLLFIDYLLDLEIDHQKKIRLGNTRNEGQSFVYVKQCIASWIRDLKAKEFDGELREQMSKRVKLLEEKLEVYNYTKPLYFQYKFKMLKNHRNKIKLDFIDGGVEVKLNGKVIYKFDDVNQVDVKRWSLAHVFIFFGMEKHLSKLIENGKTDPRKLMFQGQDLMDFALASENNKDKEQAYNMLKILTKSSTIEEAKKKYLDNEVIEQKLEENAKKMNAVGDDKKEEIAKIREEKMALYALQGKRKNYIKNLEENIPEVDFVKRYGGKGGKADNKNDNKKTIANLKKSMKSIVNEEREEKNSVNDGSSKSNKLEFQLVNHGEVGLTNNNDDFVDESVDLNGHSEFAFEGGELNSPQASLELTGGAREPSHSAEMLSSSPSLINEDDGGGRPVSVGSEGTEDDSSIASLDKEKNASPLESQAKLKSTDGEKNADQPENQIKLNLLDEEEYKDDIELAEEDGRKFDEDYEAYKRKKQREKDLQKRAGQRANLGDNFDIKNGQKLQDADVVNIIPSRTRTNAAISKPLDALKKFPVKKDEETERSLGKVIGDCFSGAAIGAAIPIIVSAFATVGMPFVIIGAAVGLALGVAGPPINNYTRSSGQHIVQFDKDNPSYFGKHLKMFGSAKGGDMFVSTALVFGIAAAATVGAWPIAMLAAAITAVTVGFGEMTAGVVKQNLDENNIKKVNKFNSNQRAQSSREAHAKSAYNMQNASAEALPRETIQMVHS